MGESYATRQPSYFFFFSNNYCTSTKICKCHFVTFDKFCAHNLQNLLKYIYFLFRTCLNKIMVIKVQRLQLREVEGRKLSFAPLWFHRPCAFLPKGFFWPRDVSVWIRKFSFCHVLNRVSKNSRSGSSCNLESVQYLIIS